MSKLKIKLRLNSLINMKWRIYFLIMRQKRNESSDGKLFSSMSNMLQGGSTAKLHVLKYCLFLGKQMVDAKGRGWHGTCFIFWPKVPSLVQYLVNLPGFWFFPLPPLKKQVYRDCISQVKIYRYIFQNYFVLFKKSFSLIWGEAI